MSETIQPDHLAVVSDTETGLYHGAYYRNHSTPSGCNRFYLAATTKAGFETAFEAAEAINSLFPDVQQAIGTKDK